MGPIRPDKRSPRGGDPHGEHGPPHDHRRARGQTPYVQVRPSGRRKPNLPPVPTCASPVAPIILPPPAQGASVQAELPDVTTEGYIRNCPPISHSLTEELRLCSEPLVGAGLEILLVQYKC